MAVKPFVVSNRTFVGRSTQCPETLAYSSSVSYLSSNQMSAITKA